MDQHAALSSPPHSSSPVGGETEVSQEYSATSNRAARVPLDHEGENEEVAVAVKRVPTVTLQIWRSILGPRGFALQHGKLIRSPSKAPNPPVQPDKEADGSPLKTGAEGQVGSSRDGEQLPQPQSLLASFRRTQSYASQSKDTSAVPRLFKRAPTVLNISDALAAPEETTPAHHAALCDSPLDFPGGEVAVITTERTSEPTRLFAGLTFRILGEAQCAHVSAAIEEAGGKVVSEASDEIVDFIIVRLVR